jgi:hypothetical protein
MTALRSCARPYDHVVIDTDFETRVQLRQEDWR